MNGYAKMAYTKTKYTVHPKKEGKFDTCYDLNVHNA